MKPARLHPKRTRKEKIKTVLCFYNSFIIYSLLLNITAVYSAAQGADV